MGILVFLAGIPLFWDLAPVRDRAFLKFWGALWGLEGNGVKWNLA